MTLNASGPISLGGSTAGQSINLELGKSATAQVSLNDTDVRSLAGVASGAIIVPTNFYGKSSATITIPSSPVNISLSATSAYTGATAGFFLNSPANGDYSSYLSTSGGGYATTKIGTWITPSSAASGYEFYATQTSSTGSPYINGFFGTWLGAGAVVWYIDPSLYNTSTTLGMTVQVRNSSTLTVVGTFTVNLSTYWSNP